MANNFLTGKLERNYEKAMESSLWIPSCHEGDPYELLADQSVTWNSIDRFGYSNSDAHIMPRIAQEIHRQRMRSSFSSSREINLNREQKAQETLRRSCIQAHLNNKAISNRL